MTSPSPIGAIGPETQAKESDERIGHLTALTASTCPRCGQVFGCGASQGWCECFELHLTPAQRETLARDYQGCLCLACLKDVTS